MNIDIVDVPTQQIATIRRRVPLATITGFFGEAFGTIASSVGPAIAGPPFGWYHGVPTTEVDVAAGFPVVGLEAGPLANEVSVDDRPGGRAVVCLHVGPYDTLADTYAEVERWMTERDLHGRDDMWEEYLSDPEAEPDPSTWRTRLVLPLA